MSSELNGSIGIGLLGAGVVGGEVARTILNPSVSGVRDSGLGLRRVFVRDTGKQRPGIPPDLITDDAESMLSDSSIAVIVEAMGGEEPARTYIASALRSGKHVVTANKEVLAKHGDELLGIADVRNVHLSYEASVGGGIPVLAVLQDCLGANRIDTIRAIINGTTNYILTSMEESGASFQDALAEAQTEGFAEANPKDDIDGYDAVYKLCILARLAWQVPVYPSSVYREGIGRIESKDLRYARELGFKVKLLAIGTVNAFGIRCRVHPALVPAGVPISNVNGVMNAVEFNGDLVGPLWLQGRGAGAGPTASAVLADIMRVARHIESGAVLRVRAGEVRRQRILNTDRLRVRFYIRLSALDRSGVLAKIAAVFGERKISIASVIQKDLDDSQGIADLVVMTHPAQESSMREAWKQLRDLDVVSKLDNVIRVEDYGCGTGR